MYPAGMNVADAMTARSELVTVELPGTRDDALEYLQEYGFSSVPVVKPVDGDGEVYRGLISRNDLIRNPDEDQLALLMQEVPTTTVDADLREAARLMVEEGARRVPVVDADGVPGDGDGEARPTIEGIVTVTDVVRAIARDEVGEEIEVGELASRKVHTTYAGTPLTVVERQIDYSGVPYAVVLDDTGDTAGIITEVDIIEVARVVQGEDDTGESIAGEDDDWKWEGIKAVGNRYFPTRNVQIPNGPAREFMTEDLITVTSQRTAREAAQEMISNDIEQIPLVRGDELTGIVCDVDLVEALV